MSIARPVRWLADEARSARWTIAAILAAAVLAVFVVPAFAADPASGSRFSAPGATASPAPAPGAVTTLAVATTSPDPSASASISPDPSASTGPTPTPSPTPWPTASFPSTVTTLGTKVKFYGRGYGHGVGLNQWGARGRAAEGQTAEQILTAYFKGATFGTTKATRPIRVLLFSGFAATSAAPMVIKGKGGTWGVSTTDIVFPAGATLKAWHTTATVDGVKATTWKLKAYDTDGTTVLYSAVVTGRPVVSPIDADARIQVVSADSTYDTFRGTITLVLASSSLAVVNTLGLDDYLRGVVPVEMSSSWPKQALRAQAIASRSYAMKRMNPGSGTWDLYDDTRSQVYRGLEAERASTDAVIALDPGVYMKYGTSIVNAFFFSTGGGATESNEYVFVSSSGSVGTPVAYLRGVADRDAHGVPYDAAATYYAWTSSTLTRDQLSAIFKADSRTDVGALTKLDLRKRGPGGRLYKVTLYGASGSKTVSADVFRAVYNAHRPSGTLPLRSNLFTPYPMP